MRVNPHMAATDPPPIVEALRWAKAATPEKPLLNLSQAAPVDPPPEPLRQAMADVILREPSSHLYGPVFGLPALRDEIAMQWSASYGGVIRPAHVAVTAGCNEAFCAVLATLVGPGDEVILPVPWYFNHKMALDMVAGRAVPLPTGPDLLPDADVAAALITPKTRAIALISPNNPCGVEYPPETLRAFLDLARTHRIALILDETYRDFHGSDARPHGLFEDPDWDDTLIQLYSFSKAYRLTGHRVGTIIASDARLAEVEKYLDTVTICAPQLGQHAALWGLQNLAEWLAGERREILKRRQAVESGFAALDGWELLGSGAYFAYPRHPFDESAATLAPKLVGLAGLLMLPGTMFRPVGDAPGAREFRIAFANLDIDGITEMFQRLSDLRPGSS